MRHVRSTLYLLALCALGANSFFWPCPEVKPDNTVPGNASDALETFMTKFPAYLYLKSGSWDDDKYSCLTIHLLDQHEKTPCGCDPYNLTIDYYDDYGPATAYGNYSINFSTQPYRILFTGLPGDMFGADRAEKLLAVFSMGEKYVILRSCQSYFINIHYKVYSYMFMPTSVDTSRVKWQCMAEDFKLLTGATYAHPGGICGANFTA